MAHVATRQQIAGLILPFRWDLVGFGLSRAHATALLAFAASSAWAAGTSLALQVFMLLCSTAAALSVALAAPRADDRPASRAPLAFALAGSVGTVGVAAGVGLGLTWPALAGYVLGGACAGYWESVWGRRFAGMRSDRIQAYTLLVTAGSALLGIALGMLPGAPMCACAAALPLGAAALFARDQREGCPGGAEADERRHRALLNILVCCLVFSTIYNMVVVMAYDFMEPGAASGVRFAANLLCALGLLALAVFLRPLGSVDLLRLVLPVTAVGFVLYLVAPASVAWVSLTVSGVGRKLFDILTWVLVAQAVTAYALPVDRYFGFLIAGKNAGYLMGLLLATVVLGYGPGVVQAVRVVPVLLLVLIVLFVWVFPERTIDQLFGVVETPARPGEADLDEKAAQVARECGCTPREAEVLLLLARGRTQAVIASKLGISTGTAHTHIVHVYQKLGVGKQQELIEKVEAAGPAHPGDEPGA